MTKTEHKNNLKALRRIVTSLGGAVVHVRYNKRTDRYTAFTCTFALGGHVFRWKAGDTVLAVMKVDVNGIEQPVKLHFLTEGDLK